MYSFSRRWDISKDGPGYSAAECWGHFVHHNKSNLVPLSWLDAWRNVQRFDANNKRCEWLLLHWSWWQNVWPCAQLSTVLPTRIATGLPVFWATCSGSRLLSNRSTAAGASKTEIQTNLQTISEWTIAWSDWGPHRFNGNHANKQFTCENDRFWSMWCHQKSSIDLHWTSW